MPWLRFCPKSATQVDCGGCMPKSLLCPADNTPDTPRWCPPLDTHQAWPVVVAQRANLPWWGIDEERGEVCGRSDVPCHSGACIHRTTPQTADTATHNASVRHAPIRHRGDFGGCVCTAPPAHHRLGHYLPNDEPWIKAVRTLISSWPRAYCHENWHKSQGRCPDKRCSHQPAMTARSLLASSASSFWSANPPSCLPSSCTCVGMRCMW